MASEIKVDTVSEKTSANGVTIDGVNIKDSKIVTANSIDSDVYVDGSIDTAHIADAQITTAKLSTAVFTGATDIGAAIVDADLFLMDDGAGGTIRKTTAARIKTYIGSFNADAAQVFNESSADVDFRIESNGNANMFTLNGGNDIVGIGADPDLGIGLHIKNGDAAQGTAQDDADSLVIENSGGGGMSLLNGHEDEATIAFGDKDDADIGFIKYHHNTNNMNFGANAVLALQLTGGVITTGGETAGDVSAGGICLDQNALDTNIMTFKSSDVAHSFTNFAEADTYADFSKMVVDEGGLRIRGFTGHGYGAIHLQGQIDASDSDSGEATNSLAAIQIAGYGDSGTGGTALGADVNLFAVLSAAVTAIIVKGDGEIFSNQSATVGTFDTFEDAQLVRAHDLFHKTGVIDSKFDKFVKYNEKTLADNHLIGKDENGNPTPMVNVTGMQRLHNGAIWQQYEKTERLTMAMYELAKEAIGEEKAKAILEKHEVKLLN